MRIAGKRLGPRDQVAFECGGNAHLHTELMPTRFAIERNAFFDDGVL